jgi:CRP-like cAMP-binding protein
MTSILSTFPDVITTAVPLRQQLEARYQNQTLHGFPGGQMIPMDGEQVWIVCRGVVLLSTIYPSGEESLLGLAGPSAPFGLPFTQVNPYQAMALSAVDLIQVSMADLERSPVLAQDLFRSLNRRLQQAEMMLALLGQRRVEDRLRQFLQMLKHEVGQNTDQNTDDGTRLTVRLTHQHLANALGTTRVTITRLLGQLRKEGFLDVDKHRHMIIKS